MNLCSSSTSFLLEVVFLFVRLWGQGAGGSVTYVPLSGDGSSSELDATQVNIKLFQCLPMKISVSFVWKTAHPGSILAKHCTPSTYCQSNSNSLFRLVQVLTGFLNVTVVHSICGHFFAFHPLYIRKSWYTYTICFESNNPRNKTLPEGRSYLS